MFFQSTIPFLNDPRALQLVQDVLPRLEKQWVNTLATKKVQSNREQQRRNSSSSHNSSSKKNRSRSNSRSSRQKASTYAAALAVTDDERHHRHFTDSLVSMRDAGRSPAPTTSSSPMLQRYAKGDDPFSSSPSPRPTSTGSRTSNRGLATSPYTGRSYSGQHRSHRSPVGLSSPGRSSPQRRKLSRSSRT